MTEITNLTKESVVESSDQEEHEKNSRADVIRLCLMAIIAAISLIGLGKQVLCDRHH